MAEAVTAKEPEKSLWDRVADTSADLANKALLVRRGAIQSVAAIPATVAGLGNWAIQKAGFKGYEGSAYDRTKEAFMQGIDTINPDFLKPTIKTESDKKWVEYSEIGADVAVTIATLGAGALKMTAKTGAKLAAKEGAEAVVKKTAQEAAEAVTKKAVQETAEASVKTAAKLSADDTVSILAKARAAGEAERAGVKVAAKEIAEEAVETGAKAGISTASAAAKTEYGYSEVLKIVKREKDLAGRLESLSGHGPKAEAMIDRLVAGARKHGVSGDDWTAIKNSRSLPQSLVDRVSKIREDYINAPWGIGPAWEKAKGTAAYWKEYPMESAARAAIAPVSIPFKAVSKTVHEHKGKALLLGAGVATYVGVNTLADSPASAATAEKPAETKPAEKTETPVAEKAEAPATASAGPATTPARDVPLEETVAKETTDAVIFLSKLTATSALTLALNAASKIPGLGTFALNSARGSAQSLVQEIAGGEPDINKAWDVSQEKLGKVLPGVHLNALGDFIKGKGIEDMSAEERTLVSDALTAITQPNSPKAHEFRSTLIAEAKQKAGQATQLTGLNGGGISSLFNAVEEGADFDMNDDLKVMVSDFLGIDPKNLNARNVARMMRDFAGDNKVALGLGLYAAYTTEGSPLSKAVAGLVTTMVMSFMMPHLTQMFGPMMAAAGPALGKMRDHLSEKFDQASTTGQFNTNSYGLTAPDATPVQKPMAPAATDTVADFRNNSSMMTNPVADNRNPVADNRKPDIIPAIPSTNRGQFAQPVNG